MGYVPKEESFSFKKNWKKIKRKNGYEKNDGPTFFQIPNWGRLHDMHHPFRFLLFSISNHIAKSRNCNPEIIRNAENNALVAETGPENIRNRKR